MEHLLIKINVKTEFKTLQVKYDFHFIKFPVKDRELEKSKKFLVLPWENYDVSIQEM